MSESTLVLSVTFAADAKNLKPVRDQLCHSLQSNGLGETLSSDVVLAVDEACQNIIRHAYGEGSGDIELTVSLERDWIQIELVDYSETVDPDSCLPKPGDELTPGGLGTQFMHQLMDSVAFECPPPLGVGNKLVMKRQHKGR